MQPASWPTKLQRNCQHSRPVQSRDLQRLHPLQPDHNYLVTASSFIHYNQDNTSAVSFNTAIVQESCLANRLA